ncbi:MAG: hypothetical protein OXO49_09300 [Gammaproteobacteria bacterium]|nr:hypothetical protein [Gammaproteobacteria bacterium]MDE0252778.1 hypothetical protein [Gammaproteobacteria bacterium]MDE0402214.1 hypothetical protein [Gammaproteobacteria bacterium]
MRRFLILCCVVGTVFTLRADAPEQTDIQIGRYTTMSIEATAEQEDVFLALVNISFDETVKTVEDALLELLHPKGYRLYLPNMQADQPHVFKSLILPDTHRQLGPLTLRDALETLAGAAWYLVHDPVYRILSFEICSTSTISEVSQ